MKGSKTAQGLPCPTGPGNKQIWVAQLAQKPVKDQTNLQKNEYLINQLELVLISPAFKSCQILWTSAESSLGIRTLLYSFASGSRNGVKIWLSLMQFKKVGKKLCAYKSFLSHNEGGRTTQMQVNMRQQTSKLRNMPPVKKKHVMLLILFHI